MHQRIVRISRYDAMPGVMTVPDRRLIGRATKEFTTSADDILSSCHMQPKAFRQLGAWRCGSWARPSPSRPATSQRVHSARG